MTLTKCIASHGRIDVPCANGGIYPSAKIDDMSEQDWDKTHDINLEGVFLTVKACWAKMKEHIAAGLY